MAIPTSRLQAVKRAVSSLLRGGPKPHYIRNYRSHVRALLAAKPEAEAMALAVGGEFHAFGAALRDLLVQCGLRDGMTLVDVGCGSGRLAYALRDMAIGYVGTDVVAQMLRYAERTCGRPDWRFLRTDGLTIPLSDEVADMMAFISVFTHLRHEEAFVYLLEARRVLKPGGLVLFTFLDFTEGAHWAIFERYMETVRAGETPMHVDQFMDRAMLEVWAARLGLEVHGMLRGSDDYIALSREIVRDDGSRVAGRMSLGQSVCILRKPAAALQPPM